MNILHVPRRFVREEWGGTETVVLESCKQLVAMGHEASILCPRALSSRDQEVVEGIPVRRVSYFYPYLGLGAQARHQLDKKAGNLFSFEMLRELRRMEAPHVIHLHTGKRLGGIVRHVARARGIPYVLSLHGGLLDVPSEEARTWTEPTRGTFEWGRALGWWVGARRVEQDADAIITLGETEQARVQARWPHVKVHRLPNGVDVHRYAQGDGALFRQQHGIPLDAEVVLTVGRFDPQKNQKGAVDAVHALRQAGRERLHLVLVGPVTSASYRAEVEQRVRERGMEGCVTMLSQLEADALAHVYAAADVFLLSSVHEPFGIVVLEAWTAGCPVVATRVGGVPTFVEDGRDGILVEPGDPMAMARGLEQALGRGALGEEGRAKARREYSWETITRRLVDIYEEARRSCAARQ